MGGKAGQDQIVGAIMGHRAWMCNSMEGFIRSCPSVVAFHHDGVIGCHWLVCQNCLKVKSKDLLDLNSSSTQLCLSMPPTQP